MFSSKVVDPKTNQPRKPLFITDNRYKLQSSLEVDQSLFDIQDPDSPLSLTDILNQTLNKDDTVALDGAIFPIKQCESLKTRLNEKKIKVDINLGD